MKKNQIFCWDVDGVLIKYDPRHPEKDWRKALIDENLLEQWECFQRSPQWHVCLRDCHADTVSMLRDFLETRGWDGSRAGFMVESWLTGNTETNREALTLLKTIRAMGYPTVIISNQDGLRAAWLDRWLADHGLKDVHRFISCRIGAEKPNPAFFQAIQVTMGCAPSQLYLFDDKEENVVAALSKGWSGQIVRPDMAPISPLS